MRYTTKLIVGLLAAVPAAAIPPIEAYGGLPSVDLIALSPDGSKIALAVGSRDNRQVQVREVDGLKAIATIPLKTAKIRSLQWAGEHHILMTYSATAEITGLTGPKREWSLAIDFDLATHKAKPLLGGHVDDNVETLNTVAGSPEIRTIKGHPVAFVTGTSFVSSQGVRTLFRVNLDSIGTRQMVTGNTDTEGWVLDDNGAVAARVDYSERSGAWTLWTRRGDRLVKSMAGTYPIDAPSLIGFGRTAASVMVETPDGDDWSYREVALGETTPSPPIDALSGSSLITDPKTGVVIGTRRQNGLTVEHKFLAEPDQRLWQAVMRAFPHAVIRIESWSDDRKKLVLRVEGKAFGAAYFLLDVTTKRAAWLANEYAAIEPEDIGETRAITYKAADGIEIPAFLTLPPGAAGTGLPLVVLPHGGPGAHDAAGFDWWAQALASRGYAVLQPQFRGSTGFGETFQAAGYGQWGRKMQTDVSDGVAFLAAAKTIDPKRVAIVGASYGGYAALAGVALQHGIYACEVSLAGPSDLRGFLSYEQALTSGARNSTLRFWQRFMGAKSPSDPVLDSISPAKLAAKVDVPLLLIHGIDDTVVPFSQSKVMAAAMAKAGHPAKLVTLPGEDHWLSRGETRTAMLRATVDFLAVNLPVGAGKPSPAP